MLAFSLFFLKSLRTVHLTRICPKFYNLPTFPNVRNPYFRVNYSLNFEGTYWLHLQRFRGPSKRRKPRIQWRSVTSKNIGLPQRCEDLKPKLALSECQYCPRRRLSDNNPVCLLLIARARRMIDLMTQQHNIQGNPSHIIKLLNHACSSPPFTSSLNKNLIKFIRSQCPSGVRRESAAARLLESWVRIPPVAWMFVLCVLYSKGQKAQPGQRSSTHKVQRTQIPTGTWMFVSCFFFV